MAIVLFLSIIGLILYYFERKNQFKRSQFIKEHFQKINQDLGLNDTQKKEKLKQFLMANGYNIAKAGIGTFKKKEFSLGLFLLGAGFFIVGAVVYLLYYFYIQKEDEIDLNKK